MRVLVTGANGQLGYDVIRHLDSVGIEYLGTDRETLDITNEDQVKSLFLRYSPDVVIHCAAYTAVDKAEVDKELCYTVNVLGTKFIAEACKEINAKMLYISTDYVFDGEGDRPFDVADKPNPINYYGQTKYEGEIVVQKLLENYFIVRISWVFGVHGNNFIKSMLKLGKERNEISVVADQIGSPSYTRDLAELFIEMIETNKYGIYHATNEGYCSWYELARELLKEADINVLINPINTEDYPTKAKRPKNSRLSKETLKENNFKPLNYWKDAVKHMIGELNI